MNLAELADLLEHIANDGHLPDQFSVEEVTEAVLGREPGSRHAWALVMFNNHPDKKGAWERFVQSTLRIYGPHWRTVIASMNDHQLKLGSSWTFACSRRGCMELAWGRICDRCLVERLG